MQHNHTAARAAARLGAAGLLAAASTAQAGFTDVTTQAGLASLQWDQSGGFEWAEPNFMSGGAAAADVNGDGWTDLYVTRLDAPDSLYLNNQAGGFTDVTAAWGLSTPVDSNGAAFADVDNDGDLDLYVTTVRDDTKRYHLYIHNGASGYTEEAVARGADITTNKTHAGYGVAFGDYDKDGYLDLMTTEWGNTTPANVPNFVSHSRLLKNDGAANPGHFSDVTASSGIAPTGDDSIRYGFAPRWTDLDGDGHLDLAVASDFGNSQLFWNNGDGTFTDGTAAAGVGTDENGMGSTIADFNNDGKLDWFVTSIYDPGKADREGDESGGWGITGNRLYTNQGGRVFDDTTDAAGVRNGDWGWGTVALDYDNDGDLDLSMTNGVVFPEFDPDDFFNANPMRFWENQGDGTFVDVSDAVGVNDIGSGKGMLTLDYDNDGDLDMLVINNAGLPILYRNDAANTNGYLKVDLEGSASNKDGVGALITVIPDLTAPEEMMIREVFAGNDFLGQSEITAHFGLGAWASLDLVRVQWPSGAVTELAGVSANQTLVIAEVPEPASAALLAAGVGLALGRRRRA
ncbi:MAG: FG-GAP-like repeat-containing protein [Planctomycetota bacterium]